MITDITKNADLREGIRLEYALFWSSGSQRVEINRTDKFSHTCQKYGY